MEVIDKELYKTPAKLYSWLIGVFFSCVFISFIILYNGDSQLQQNGFGYMILEVVLFLIILFVVSVVTTIVYKEWFVKNWYINTFIFALSGIILGTILYSLIVDGGIG